MNTSCDHLITISFRLDHQSNKVIFYAEMPRQSHVTIMAKSPPMSAYEIKKTVKEVANKYISDIACNSYLEFSSVTFQDTYDGEGYADMHTPPPPPPAYTPNKYKSTGVTA